MRRAHSTRPGHWCSRTRAAIDRPDHRSPGRVSTRIVTMPIQPRASNASKSTQFNGRLPEAKLVVPMLH
ncbi:hypothetical protein BZL30_0117 [Mycobacterium kansasii]|uniref:Uncharacterized protein n=1 Tax=Mycobacterium kansasii TaxID=1768 RepID=A0A1V3XRY8_MYCKA|nr:hypothetical protein BZL30_0117 [Mycobacterium kansasii]